MSKALVIIDWQNEWTNPTSEYYIGSDLAAETSKTNELIDLARNNGCKIVFVKHHENEGDAFRDSSGGTDLVKNLDARETDVKIDKSRISAFYNTDIVKLEELVF